jgi:uncharacterized Zn-binding protein involved in type VI secretion
MLPAARITDMHVCPMWTGVVPHVGGPILPPAEPTVMVGFLPAARMGDMCVCAGGPDSILTGVPTILIGYKPAARLSDLTLHGGSIVAGCPTVLYGGAAPPAPPPPPPPPADMTPDEIAFMQAGNSPEDLERRRAEQEG